MFIEVSNLKLIWWRGAPALKVYFKVILYLIFENLYRTQTEHPPPVAVLDHINSGGHSTGIEGPSPIASPRSPPTFFDGSETMPIGKTIFNSECHH